MPLTPGTKLGPYEIQSPIGAGGMGEVYRARDTRLDRTVAIKVLNSDLVASTDLRARFEREAKIISQLQHPHICVLHDVGKEGATDFLVMEFLEGESLADRLKRGPLGEPELLKTAVEIADALEKAHRAGVVHRDLKPGNVMLTKMGAKLLDFGLAKPVGAAAVSGTGSGSSRSTLAAALTQTSPAPGSPLSTAGAVVGTVQYMSPEQVQGLEADARSDIFAFGLMLFEMVTGKRAFEGKTQATVVGQILAVDPPSASTVRPGTMPALDRVIRLCLEKDPDERLQTAHDLKLELERIAAERPSAGTTAATKTPNSVAWAAGLVAALLLGAGAGFLVPRSHPAAPSIRTVIDPPPASLFRLRDDTAGPPVLSPDGRTLAFTAASEGKQTLWVRPMNSLEARALPGTDDAFFPFWSPDGSSLGFFADGKLKTIELNGGAPIIVCDAQLGRGGTWGPDGNILFSASPNSPILRVTASGGTPVEITKIDSSRHTSHRWPFVLPDGKHFLYLAMHHDLAQSGNDTVYFATVDGRENRDLMHASSNAIYADGFLLFARGDQLMAQPFDPTKGSLRGEPRMVAKGVMNDASTWHMDASATDNGLLVFGSGLLGDLQLVWLDRSGKQVGIVADKLANLQFARISPQGDRVAMQIDNGINDVWVVDLVRGVRTRLTFGPNSNLFPLWSPDGKWIAYLSSRNGKATLYRKPADGSGAEELLLTDDQVTTPNDWSSDGKTLLYHRGFPGSASIWAVPLEGERKPYMVSPRGMWGRLSPNQHWLAYQSAQSGMIEIYVVAFGGGQGKWQVSANGGQSAQWSKDGKELYYFDGTQSLVSVPVQDSGGALQFGSPQILVNRWTVLSFPFFDVSADGKKILLEQISQQVSQSVTVVSDFVEGLEK
jgi:eukaryotic-like serine/threonine-protein kinase